MTRSELLATCFLWPFVTPLAWAARLAVRRSGRPRIWFEFFSQLLSLLPFDPGILGRPVFYARTQRHPA